MSWRRDDAEAARSWIGSQRPYDLVKELAIALLVVVLRTVLLAALLSSPDEPQMTLSHWARVAP